MGALAFYQRVLGYTHDTMDLGPGGTYYLLKKDGDSRGGLMRSAEPKAQSMWLPYVAVAACDATADKARSLGGQVLSPPTDIPGVGRFAVFADPVGAAIAVLEPLAEDGVAGETVSQATAASVTGGSSVGWGKRSEPNINGRCWGSLRSPPTYNAPTQPGAPQRQRSLPSWCVSP